MAVLVEGSLISNMISTLEDVKHLLENTHSDEYEEYDDLIKLIADIKDLVE